MKETNKMKKLMIAAAIVCAAVVSQAASFNWATDKMYGVDPAAVGDNGTYDAGSVKAQRIDKAGCTLAYVLTLYTAGTETVIGTASGSVEQDLGMVSVFGINIAAAEASTTYDWVIKISGTQDTLTEKTSDTYDYSNSAIAATLSGSVKTAAFGDTDLTTEVPSSWTVSGISKEDPEPTPEPTSGLLMLLGMAGLALRRKQK